ncbi:hypothetical protein [Paracidovorax avenae]|uniref:hypothetical protein n=1 Tax=Paracidovorax avenae TaxID=80867 RepID=UPI00131451B5|nr:hypothetical protein [Paracidovorax avenae]
MIRPQMFSGGALPLADPGEVIFQSAGASNSQTVFNWVVPAGVYEVCMLGVSSHKAYATRVSRGGNDLLNTTWASGTNNAHGGDGGDARNVNTVYNGGGGAGGYSGPGGLGMYQRDEGMGNYSLIKGTDGQGGGGAVVAADKHTRAAVAGSASTGLARMAQQAGSPHKALREGREAIKAFIVPERALCTMNGVLRGFPTPSQAAICGTATRWR